MLVIRLYNLRETATLNCIADLQPGQICRSMTHDQHILSPLAVHRDCPRCGKPVQPVDLVTECPHCGYEIRNPRPVPLAETIISGEVSELSAAASTEAAAAPAEPDPLVGTDLDV